MTIHSTHPFAEDPSRHDPARRFRARLGGAVTLWAAGALEGPREERAAGLTVSSVMLALGDEPTVLGLIDPDSDLADRLAVGTPYVVSLLQWRHRDLAEVFAGLAPSPGGPFATGAWTATAAGPVPDGVRTWLAAEVRDLRPVGWSLLVEGVVREVTVGEDAPDGADRVASDDAPLLHRRGRYERPGGAR